jgi:hypothetical protein
VNGDRSISGLSPFHFLVGGEIAASELHRKSGVPTEALARRKAGSDQGTAVNDRGQRNSRRAHGATNKERHVCARRRVGEPAGAIPRAKARKGRSERCGSERLYHTTPSFINPLQSSYLCIPAGGSFFGSSILSPFPAGYGVHGVCCDPWITAITSTWSGLM